MQLNNRIPGLPEWPPIHFAEQTREFIVGGRNLSYFGYDWGRKTIGLLELAAIGLSFVVAFKLNETVGGAMVVLSLISLLFFFNFWVLKFMCERLFSTNIQVRFTERSIVCNGKTYERLQGMPVQFRAQGTPLSDEQIERNNDLYRKGKLPKSRAYDSKFRKIEMIYGSRVVLITSVADEDRAAQFAVALQHGYDFAGDDSLLESLLSSTSTVRDNTVLPE